MNNSITVIVALITALAAILAPLASSLIASRGAYKLRLVELFYQSKLEAYLQFLRLSSEAAQESPCPLATLAQLQTAALQASLFSSKETQKAILAYSAQTLEFISSIEEKKLYQEDIDKWGATSQAVISAMCDELQQYQHH